MISRNRFIVLALALLVLVQFTITRAQSPTMSQGGADREVSANERKAIVDSVGALLERMYVFPDKAKLVSKALRQNLKNGKYDSLTSITSLAEILTADMRNLSSDGHLWVEPADLPPLGQDDEQSGAESRNKRFEYGKSINFGIRKAEILPGNIGLLDLQGFFQSDIAAPTAIAAMNFLGNCRALIIDVRSNGGGDPSMIQLLTGYFFDEPVHLNSFYDRTTDSISQFWTQAQVIGPRMADIPLYVLTSSHSFSAAEEFAYNLKNLKRAVLVGETTGGGAHPNDLVHFPSLRINVSVAWGRAINPITGTNWEGTGVTPHIAVSSDKALDVARMEIFDSLIKIESDSLKKYQLAWLQSGLRLNFDSYSIPPDKLNDFIGQYGPRTITVEKGILWYQRDSGPKSRLIPMSQDLFQHADADYFRIRFVRDASGRVIELVGMYLQGHEDTNRRGQ